MAVLGAEARLEVDEVVDLDGVAEVLAAQACCCRHERPAARRPWRGGRRGRRRWWRGLPASTASARSSNAGHAGSLRAALNGVQLERCSVCRVARVGCQRGSARARMPRAGEPRGTQPGAGRRRPPSTCCAATASATCRCGVSPASSAWRPARSTGTWPTSRSCSSRWPTCCSPRCPSRAGDRPPAEALVGAGARDPRGDRAGAGRCRRRRARVCRGAGCRAPAPRPGPPRPRRRRAAPSATRWRHSSCTTSWDPLRHSRIERWRLRSTRELPAPDAAGEAKAFEIGTGRHRPGRSRAHGRGAPGRRSAGRLRPRPAPPP